jgi:hypothetical protein
MPPTPLDVRLAVVERVTALFRWERFTYLGITSVSLLLLLVSAGALIAREQASAEVLIMLFGSSGLITFSITRVLSMWERSIDLILAEGRE